MWFALLAIAGGELASQGRHRKAPNFRVNSELVLIRVSVVDRSDRPVMGLTSDDFQVLDNGRPQAIESFGEDDAPLSLGIAFDASSSMETVIAHSRQTVAQLCRWAEPEDESFLVTFAARARLDENFTSNCGDIGDRLLWMQASGDTSLLDGVYLALETMRRARNPHRALVLVTDGGENASRYGVEEVKRLAVEAGAQVYALSPGGYRPGGPVEEERGPELLRDLARATGGRYIPVPNAQDLPAIARQVSLELRNEYVIGYRPPSGRHHAVSIKLPNSPRYSIYCRREYYR